MNIYYFIAFLLASCSSEFSGDEKFLLGNGGQGVNSENLATYQASAQDKPVAHAQISSGNATVVSEDNDLVGGEARRDCAADPLEDASVVEVTEGHDAVNHIVNYHCLAGLPPGSSVFDGENERQLLCNLIGFQNVESVRTKGWHSTGDNYTWTFEKSGVDSTTGLPRGRLKSNPAGNVTNRWIKGITCRGKLHSQCQYFRNDQGKIDCTGL